MERAGGDRGRYRTIVVAYFVAQAVLTVAWWTLLRTSADGRSAFELATEPGVLDAFLVADVVVFVAGSLTSARAIRRGWSSAPAIIWFTAGGVVSATLFLIALVVHADSAATGVAPMVAASIATVIVAVVATPASSRRAGPVETAAVPG